MNKLIIIGMGGLGREFLAKLQYSGDEVDVIGYYDDLKQNVNLPYFGKIDEIKESDVPHIITIANAKVKKDIVLKLKDKISYQTINHGTCYSSDLKIGFGTFISHLAVVTVNVEIGSHCLINGFCSIGHDCLVGDYSAVMPGANVSGNVKIGEGVLVGTGAHIIQGVTIGDLAVVGAGAVVTKDVKPGTTVVGVPARELGS